MIAASGPVTKAPVMLSDSSRAPPDVLTRSEADQKAKMLQKAAAQASAPTPVSSIRAIHR